MGAGIAMLAMGRAIFYRRRILGDNPLGAVFRQGGAGTGTRAAGRPDARGATRVAPVVLASVTPVSLLRERPARRSRI